MEENDIKAKVPEVYQSIVKCEEDVDWGQVKEDLEDLNWLDFEGQVAIDMIVVVWKVADRWGVSVLQSEPRFKVLKITKVKLGITNFVYNIQDDKEIKQICQESKGRIEDMLFFSCAKSMLYAANEENLPNLALRVYDIYQEFKGVLSGFFIHFDKQLGITLNTSISKMLDSVFYQKVLFHMKIKLNSEPSTQKIIAEIEKSGGLTHEIGVNSSDSASGPSSAYTSNNNVYAMPYYPSNSVYLRENMYRGQLNADGKREGYGKITYFGGDAYEGYWENDKPHGEGLYTWKMGGKYLGTFVKNAISGFGQRVYSSGNLYKGEFVSGKKHGKGEMFYKNGDHYEGAWDEDFLHGEGKYTWNTGDFYIGKFIKDLREGQGLLTLADGTLIEGVWRDNTMVEI